MRSGQKKKKRESRHQAGLGSVLSPDLENSDKLGNCSHFLLEWAPIPFSMGSSRPRDEPTSPVSPALQILYAIVKLNNQRRQWHPTPALLPGESHRWRNLAGCSPWGHEELDMTEQLHFHFSLSCIGEGNGNPLQCSCLENARDGGAWWAAVYGVTQNQT